ncbi:hypothetical protein NP92_11850 [Anoxybacillus gonensis]|nr:hypothetical protein AFK25_14505 [Anoxybacillus gonensis]AXM88918.1 hypothetical protein B379_07060 [Anoxybacillus ayderensis G10]KGP59799.1 hypothetical protein NP92_11850 [Anoxybacillus gonensis]
MLGDILNNYVIGSMFFGSKLNNMVGNILDTYVIISIFFGWKFISRMQRNFVIFTTISDYIIFKFMAATAIGWLVTPFYIIGFIIKMISRKKNKKGKIYVIK